MMSNTNDNRFGIQSMPSVQMRKKKNYFNNNDEYSSQQQFEDEYQQIAPQPTQDIICSPTRQSAPSQRTQKQFKKNFNPLSFLANPDDDNLNYRKLVSNNKRNTVVDTENDRDNTPIMTDRNRGIKAAQQNIQMTTQALTKMQQKIAQAAYCQGYDQNTIRLSNGINQARHSENDNERSSGSSFADLARLSAQKQYQRDDSQIKVEISKIVQIQGRNSNKKSQLSCCSSTSSRGFSKRLQKSLQINKSEVQNQQQPKRDTQTVASTQDTMRPTMTSVQTQEHFIDMTPRQTVDSRQIPEIENSSILKPPTSVQSNKNSSNMNPNISRKQQEILNKIQRIRDMKSKKENHMNMNLGQSLNSQQSQNNRTQKSFQSGRSGRAQRTSLHQTIGSQTSGKSREQMSITAVKTESSYNNHRRQESIQESAIAAKTSNINSLECNNSANQNSLLFSKTDQRALNIDDNDISAIRPNTSLFENEKPDDSDKFALIEKQFQMRRSSSAPRSSNKSEEINKNEVGAGSTGKFKEWLVIKNKKQQEKDELQDFFGGEISQIFNQLQ